MTIRRNKDAGANAFAADASVRRFNLIGDEDRYNRWLNPLEDLDRLLARLPEDADVGDLASPRELAFCAAYAASRHQLNRTYAAEVGRSTGLPIVTLPYLPKGIRGPADLETLTTGLLSAPQSAAQPGPQPAPQPGTPQ